MVRNFVKQNCACLSSAENDGSSSNLFATFNGRSHRRENGAKSERHARQTERHGMNANLPMENARRTTRMVGERMANDAAGVKTEDDHLDFVS